MAKISDEKEPQEVGIYISKENLYDDKFFIKEVFQEKDANWSPYMQILKEK